MLRLTDQGCVGLCADDCRGAGAALGMAMLFPCCFKWDFIMGHKYVWNTHNRLRCLSGGVEEQGGGAPAK